MNPILNSDQLNSEAQKVLTKLCHDFENPKIDSYNAQIEASDAIQTLINKARKEELETLNYDGGGNLITWAGDGKAKLVSDRIAELSTQEENNE